jgi:uridine kinase
VLHRAGVRDGADALPRYEARYLPAQRLYEAECRPAQRADVLLDNRDPQRPVVLRWPRRR